jgi:hypothetical protein
MVLLILTGPKDEFLIPSSKKWFYMLDYAAHHGQTVLAVSGEVQGLET